MESVSRRSVIKATDYGFEPYTAMFTNPNNNEMKVSLDLQGVVR